MTTKLSLYEDLMQRGLVHQSTDPALPKLLERAPMRVYAGFDPTADSLHLGSLMPLLALRRFQMAGHTPVAVVGGATGMIGDPSGRSDERQLLSDDRLAHNLEGITRDIRRFLDFEGPHAAIVMNNADWCQKLSMIDFLRDVGKHFSVNMMLTKDSVKSRISNLESGISYTEFSYMLLQSYDFLYLFDEHGVQLQVGGSDQWGNITAGCDLIRRCSRRRREGHDAFGLTFPLLTKSDGRKFGKSEKGNVWLDARKTSPYHFYQFLVQTSDADVMKLLNMLSFLPHSELVELDASLRSQPEERLAQKALAQHLTALVHGETEAAQAVATSLALFEGRLETLDAATLQVVFSEAPTTRLQREDLLENRIGLVDLLVQTGLCASRGAARKDIQGGGIYLNHVRCSDAAQIVQPDNWIDGELLLLRKGKKNYHIVLRPHS